jgi:riboflavin kinase
VGDTVPLHPLLRIRGTVVKGFGHGSRQLGIPTANIDADSLRTVLAEAVTGIFAGWASVGDSAEVYPTACSIGWNPVFGNNEKTAEPWLLHDFGEGASFVGQQIRVLLCAYIRPEASWTGGSGVWRRRSVSQSPRCSCAYGYQPSPASRPARPNDP